MYEIRKRFASIWFHTEMRVLRIYWLQQKVDSDSKTNKKSDQDFFID